VAGSLDGRARRVRRLEGLGRERPAPSRTEEEARALDAEIRELEEELQALGADPDGWRHASSDRAHLTLDEHIAAIEKEIGDDDDH
jgi:hypothetical protein